MGTKERDPKPECTEENSANTQQNTAYSFIPVRKGSGGRISEDIPCSSNITTIMDRLREFVIGTDSLRD